MILLENKTNVGAPDATWPYGKILDDTGVNDGTPVDEQVYQDVHQLYSRIFALSGLTANGLPDNQTNTFQLFLALMEVVTSDHASYTTKGVWVNPGNLISGSGGLTIGVGDTIYNRYKIIGRTFFWSFQVRTATISGSPTSLVIENPTAVTSAGYNWVNDIPTLGFYNGDPVLVVTPTSNSVTISLVSGGAFTNGTNDQTIEVQLVMEIEP